MRKSRRYTRLGCLAHRTEVDHPSLRRKTRSTALDDAVERDMRPPAEDQGRRIVAEQVGNRLILHVVRDGLHGIQGRPMHQEEILLPADRVVADLGQLGESAQDGVPQLLTNGDEAIEALLLVVVAWAKLSGIDGGEGTIADALHTDGLELTEPPPRVQGARSGKAEIPGNEDALVTSSLRRRQHGAQGVRVSVDVRQTQKPHDDGI